MAHIYIASVDTPGIFAAMIRKFLKQRYIYVVISGDAMLDEAAIYCNRYSNVSEKSIYLFLLYCKTIA